MPMSRRRFSLADMGLIAPPPDYGLTGIGAIDPIELVNIFAPMSGMQKEVPTVIDEPLKKDGLKDLTRMAQKAGVDTGVLPDALHAEKSAEPSKSVVGPPASKNVVQEQAKSEFAGMTAQEMSRRAELMQRQNAVNRAVSSGGLAGFGGLIGTILGGKRREELKALNARALEAEEQLKNLGYQQKMAQLEYARQQAIIRKSQAVQAEQYNAYEELNNAHWMKSLDKMPEEVRREKLKTAGIVLNEDGTVPTWEDDLLKVFTPKQIAKWSAADRGFAAQLPSLATIDRDLSKPFYSSLAIARQRALQIETAQVNLKKAKALFTKATEDETLDHMKDFNTLLNSFIDNASQENRSQPFSDEYRAEFEAGLREQSQNILDFARKANLPLLDSTIKTLQDPVMKEFEGIFEDGERPQMSMVPLEQRMEHQQTVVDAVNDVKSQIQRKVRAQGPVNQRQGSAAQTKDKVPPVADAKLTNREKLKRRRKELLRKQRGR